uniref:Uncharacterized protein n=1 Tax=Rhizophora mucronata TaxID=61149 RepID=A0A2P2KQH9_RHIMU
MGLYLSWKVVTGAKYGLAAEVKEDLCLLFSKLSVIYS